MRRPFLFAVAVAICPAVLSAQSSLFSGGSSGGRSSGMSGTSGGGSSGMFGSSSGGSSTGGMSGLGASGTIGLGSARGSGSGGSLAGGGLSSSGLTSQPGALSGQTTLGASSIGQGAFVGRSDTTGRFVGQRTAGQNSNINMGNLLQGLQGLGRNGGFENGQSNEQPKLGIRPTLRVGFDVPRSLSPAISTQRMVTRLPKIVARRPELAGMTLATDNAGRTVLRGTVANEDARELAAALVRLEPGVCEVVNELTVAPGVPAPTP
jgi:hypothetical protein